MMVLLSTNKYDFKVLRQTTNLCYTLGVVDPLKILKYFIKSGDKNLHQIYYDSLFLREEHNIEKFSYALKYQHYSIIDWLMETDPNLFKSPIFLEKISYAISDLFLNDRFESLTYLLELKMEYDIPIFAWKESLIYIFDEIYYRGSTYHLHFMQLLYNYIKDDIPPNYSEINKNQIMTLASNGHQEYFDFLMQIIVTHQMLNKNEIIKIIKGGFIVACQYGRLQMAKFIYDTCTTKPNKYGQYISFAASLQLAFDKCIERAANDDDYLSLKEKEYTETIKWIHTISRKSGYIPIHVTYRHIYNKKNTSTDLILFLEKLVIENI